MTDAKSGSRHSLESRMPGNGHVRFGRGRGETQFGCAPCAYLTMTRCTHLPCHLVQLAGTLLILLVDAFHYFRLCLRSPATLAAENLFLRQQFALYRERDVRPRHATHAARLALIWLGRRFDWRNAIAACFGPEAVHCSPAGPNGSAQPSSVTILRRGSGNRGMAGRWTNW